MRYGKLGAALIVTVAALGVVAAALWVGGGPSARDGWEAAAWTAAIFLLWLTPLWAWALQTPLLEARQQDGGRTNSHHGDVEGTVIQVAGDVHGNVTVGGIFQGANRFEAVDHELTDTAPAMQAGVWSALVTEVNPYDVGVHRSRPGAHSRDMSVYVARDKDKELRARLEQARTYGGMVLVVGDSTAGKTRAAWNAVYEELAGSRLFVPAVGSDVRGLLYSVNCDTPAVVWFDDLDKHLNADTGLDAALIHDLIQANVAVVATLRTRFYHRYKEDHTSSSASESGDRAAIEAGWQLLRGVEPLYLDRLWSSKELERAAALAEEQDDDILAEAIQRQRVAGEHGVAEYLAAAPELAALWHSQRDSVGTEDGHPLGHRVVAAAVDLSRIGLESLSSELLRAAVLNYSLPAAQRPETFEKALQWATEVHYGVSSLLIPISADTWRPFDYLVDTVKSPIPLSLWDAAIDAVASPEAHAAIGLSAYHANLIDPAEAAWKFAADAGHGIAMTSLGGLMEEQGAEQRAEECYHAAIEDQDEPTAMLNLGFILLRRGDDDEAEKWWRRAAEKGYEDALFHLGFRKMGQAQLAEAEAFFRRAAEQGHPAAMTGLGMLSTMCGDSAGAEAWWRKAADRGDNQAMTQLAQLLRSRGDVDEAEEWDRLAWKSFGRSTG